MLHNQRIFVLDCMFCGHTSHIGVTSGSDLNGMTVRCPVCGHAAGALGDSEVVQPEPENPSSGQRRRRATSLVVIERRTSAALVRPFVGRISNWQKKAAYLRAKLTALKTDRKETLLAQSELRNLRTELQSALDTVCLCVQRNPASGRVRDIALALDRLDEHLLELSELTSLRTSHRSDMESDDTTLHFKTKRAVSLRTEQVSNRRPGTASSGHGLSH